MQKTYHKPIVRLISAIFIFTLLINIPATTSAQTLAVQGVVSASPVSVVTGSLIPVKYASVTFMNADDTTQKIILLTDSLGQYSVSLPTSVQPSGEQPADFELGQNYPNPFASSTAISYQLKRQSNVRVTIYDILGREIKNFEVGMQEAGLHGVVWNGKDNLGAPVAAGVYFYRLQAQDKTLVKKMVFGTGEKNVVVFPPKIFSSKGLELKKEMSASLQVGTYKVRVESTDSTSPAIYTQQKTVTLESDTTLNFTVNSNAAMVYFDNPQQVIRGYGAANILPWRADMTASEIETAFGTGNGQIGFSILRLRISPTPSDWGNNVTTAKAAYDKGVTIIASPWSPPASMKTNNSLVGGELREDAYGNYAAHLDSFVNYMSGKGAPVYAVSVQNEPDITVTYESCDWTPAQMLKFMKENAGAIGTKVMAPESFQFRRQMSDPILNDSAATANLGFVSGHIYGGGLSPYPLAREKGKEVWMTEYLINSPGSGTNMDTSLAGALATGKSISDAMKAGWNAYVYWYIVRYYGPIGDGEMGIAKGTVTKKGYVMSQFARFVRPGFNMVSVTDNSSSTLVDVTAYRFGSTKVIVAVNRRTSAKAHQFNIWNGGADLFTPYVTSNGKNCEQQADIYFNNGSFTYTLEPQSVTTFVSE